MKHPDSSYHKKRQTILISLTLILFIGLSYVWFHPLKMQSIISMSQKPAVFYVDDGYHQYDGEVNIDFQKEFVDLWCLKRQDANAPLYHTGDYLLVYQDFNVRISPNGGFLYGQNSHAKETYQIRNRKAVEKIKAKLDQHYVSMK